jgi:hypothetical protein
MSNGARSQRGQALPSFEGEAQAFAEDERAGSTSALPIAIAEAAHAAADYLTEHGIETPMTFEVTRVNVVVSPNPGPKTYRVVITPGG